MRVRKGSLRSLRSRGLIGLALAGAVVLTPAAGTLAARLADGEASPARAHAQVIAQSVVRFGDDDVAWRIVAGQSGWDADSVRAAGYGFLLGRSGITLVEDEETEVEQRLARGEAMALRPGTDYTRLGVGDDEARHYELVLVDASTEDDEAVFSGEAIEGIAGKRDVDLVRDALKAGEDAMIPAGDAPTLILVTEGEIEVYAADEDDVVTLERGEAAEFVGEIEVTAGDDGRASFVAAVIGPEIGDGERRNGQATPEAGPGSGEPGSSDTGPAPTEEPVSDADEDGLSDEQEADLGTDPNDADSDDDGLADGAEVNEYQSDPLNEDTDQDGLSDGDEVNQYGSSPASMDTDADMLPDYNEVMQHGTDPAAGDTDGDGVSDHDELGYATDPRNADSDGDGLVDGKELFELLTDPLNTDSDQDGLSDGDEVNSYGSSPMSNDTDGDMLPDYNEVMQHGTNPAVADTDGDGFSDHDELGYNTSPVNADSDGDGANDGDEILGGTNPNDPTSTP